MHFCIRPSRTTRPARGISLVELMAAAALLAVLLVATVRILSAMAVQQRAIDHRHAAIQMADNAMERAFATPYSQLTPGEADTIATTVVSQEMLRSAELDVTFGPDADEEHATRIDIAVRWHEGADGVERTHRLTAWRYRLTSNAHATP